MERVWQRQYANHAEAKADITDYIVGFYNCKRINSALGSLRPPSTNGKWQHANLSLCPKLLDHSTANRARLRFRSLMLFFGFRYHWYRSLAIHPTRSKFRESRPSPSQPAGRPGHRIP
jgi:hypothetical protein